MNLRFFFFVFSLFLILEKGYAQPDVGFYPSRYKICSGTSLTLHNTSTFASSYDWFLDGIHFSSSFDTTIILVEPCYDLKEVKLIACDTMSGQCDSSFSFVEVFDTCFFHWHGDFLNCPGDTITLNANPEAIHTWWDVQGPHVYITGCDTCPSISFVLQQNNLTVEKHSTYSGNCSDIITFEYLCLISKLAEQNKKEIRIFPNPFSDFLQVETIKPVIRIRVINLLTSENFCFEGDSSILDFSGFASGMYCISLEFGDLSIATYRVIKN